MAGVSRPSWLCFSVGIGCHCESEVVRPLGDIGELVGLSSSFDWKFEQWHRGYVRIVACAICECEVTEGCVFG